MLRKRNRESKFAGKISLVMGTPSIFTSLDGKAEYGNVTPPWQFLPWFKDRNISINLLTLGNFHFVDDDIRLGRLR